MLKIIDRCVTPFLIASMVFGSQITSAAVTIGGPDLEYIFEDDDFVDVFFDDDIGESFSTFSVFGPSPADVAAAITDQQETTGVIYQSGGDGFIHLGFSDSNLLTNGPGVDLVLFELGLRDPLAFALSLEMGEMMQTYTPLFTGTTYFVGTDAYELNAVEIDLSTFGVAPDASVSDFYVGLDITNPQSGSTALLTLVGANPVVVPVPAAVWLFSSGLLGLVGVARRRT